MPLNGDSRRGSENDVIDAGSIQFQSPSGYGSCFSFDVVKYSTAAHTMTRDILHVRSAHANRVHVPHIAMASDTAHGRNALAPRTNSNGSGF